MADRTTTGSFTLNPTVLAEAEAQGRAWETVVIEEGWSPNGKWYSREAIMDPGLPALVEGTFAMDEHNLALPDSVLRRVGVNQSPKAVIGTDGKARLMGVFRPISEELRESLLNAWNAGAAHFAGLSIRGDGVVKNQFVEALGKVVPVVTKITSIRSVDVVKQPARGGAFVGLLESEGAEEGAIDMTPEELQELLAQAAQAGAEQAIALLAEAGAEDDEDEEYEEFEESDFEDDEDYEDDDGEYYEDEEGDELAESEGAYLDELEQTGAELAALRDTVRRQAGMQAIEAALAESKLPAVVAGRARERLVESMNYGALFRGPNIDEGVVSTIIESERAYAAQLNPNTPAGTPAGAITGIVHARDRVIPRISATFKGVSDDKGNQPFTSLTEAYCQWHGAAPWDLSSTKVYKSLFSKYDSEEDSQRLAESIDTSTFGDAWANVLYKEMLDDYRQQPFNDHLQFISKFRNLKDFRDHKVVRVGGYGNFPKVLEGATYQYVTSPTDEGTSLRAWKYGGLEKVTWEGVVNDDVDALRDIPSKMAYGLARTEYEFYMDMLFIDNAVMGYDGVALYDTNAHDNYATAQAILIATFKTAQTKMRLQPVYGASSDVEVMGPRGKIKYIVCRLDDVERINTIVSPSDAVRYDGFQNTTTDIDPWAFRNRGIVVLPYEKLDVLALPRMFFIADPKMAGVNVITAGHLNGRRDPEMWAQTDPSTGEPFQSDTLVYKARHVYGGVVTDHRPVRRHDLSA